MKEIHDPITDWLLKEDKSKINRCSSFLVLLGISLPFFLVTYIHSYNAGDVMGFRYWADCWSPKIYLDCPKFRVNYPAIGLAFSAGIIRAISSIFEITDSTKLDAFFRYYLAVFDSLNFLLFIWLARLMQFHTPILIALILLILPSTWIGGAVWGQIDNIALFFCLVSTIAFFKSILTNKIGDKHQLLWLVGSWLFLGMMSFCAYILTKQLAIFSLPFFFLLLLIITWKLWKDFRVKGIACLLCSLILLILFFHYLDRLFELPSQFYHSSYFFVWREGSHHGDKISGNGFNIWMFLGRDMWSSSHHPFSTLKMGMWQKEISPYTAGILLYASLIAFLLMTGLKSAFRIVNKKINAESTDNNGILIITLLCLFHGLSHLGFNVLLSGTHERYLYLGYPFLLISVTWLYFYYQSLFSWRLMLFCLFAASAYGSFVFSQISMLPGFLFPLQRHEFLASIHLFLLILLLDLWIKVCRIDRTRRNWVIGVTH